MTRSPLCSKPRGASTNRQKLLMVSPAPASSTKASASCATTRHACVRPWAPVPVPLRALLSCRALPKAAFREMRQAGHAPTSKPLPSAATLAKSTARQSRLTSWKRGMFVGPSATMASRTQKASRVPSPPPAAANRKLSVSSCRTRRVRLAPRAARTASSLRRALVRASCRLGDVGAGDQEHAEHRAEEEVEALPVRTDAGVEEAFRFDAMSFVGIRVACLQRFGDAFHVCGGGGQRDAGFEPSEDAQAVVSATQKRARLFADVAEGNEHLRQAGKRHRRRQHADDFARRTVHQDALAQHVGVSREPAVPERVADQRHLRATRRVVLRGEIAAQRRAWAKHAEEIRGNRRAVDALGHRVQAAGERQVEAGVREDRQVGEAMLGVLPVQVVRHGHRKAGIGDAAFREKDQPIGIRIAQWAQQYSIDDAEDRRASSDAEGEHQHRRNGEKRLTAQRTVTGTDIRVQNHEDSRGKMSGRSAKENATSEPSRCHLAADPDFAKHVPLQLFIQKMFL